MPNSVDVLTRQFQDKTCLNQDLSSEKQKVKLVPSTQMVDILRADSDAVANIMAMLDVPSLIKFKMSHHAVEAVYADQNLRNPGMFLDVKNHAQAFIDNCQFSLPEKIHSDPEQAAKLIYKTLNFERDINKHLRPGQVISFAEKLAYVMKGERLKRFAADKYHPTNVNLQNLGTPVSHDIQDYIDVIGAVKQSNPALAWVYANIAAKCHADLSFDAVFDIQNLMKENDTDIAKDRLNTLTYLAAAFLYSNSSEAAVKVMRPFARLCHEMGNLPEVQDESDDDTDAASDVTLPGAHNSDKLLRLENFLAVDGYKALITDEVIQGAAQWLSHFDADIQAAALTFFLVNDSTSFDEVDFDFCDKALKTPGFIDGLASVLSKGDIDNMLIVFDLLDNFSRLEKHQVMFLRNIKFMSNFVGFLPVSVEVLPQLLVHYEHMFSRDHLDSNEQSRQHLNAALNELVLNQDFMNELNASCLPQAEYIREFLLGGDLSLHDPFIWSAYV